MKIVRSAVTLVTLPNARRGALLTLGDEAGHEARGEATPLPGYSPDTVEDVVPVLERLTTALGDGGDSVDAIGRRLDAARELERVPSARFALETALFSLLAACTKKTVAELFGAPCSRRVALNGVVTDSDSSKWLALAKAMHDRGLATVKIKIGKGDFARELAALEQVRNELHGIALRLDANGSLGEDAGTKLDRLLDVRPDFVEEPVSDAALLALGRRAVAWAADESLTDPDVRERLLVADGIGAIVLKPAILGGFLRCRALAAEAASRGLGVVVTHLFDGDVAHAATCELALSIDGVLACGLDRHAGLRAESPHLRVPGFVVGARA